MVKNTPSNAGEVNKVPHWGTKIPHATGQVNPQAIAREKPAHLKEIAYVLQLRPNTAKNK